MSANQALEQTQKISNQMRAVLSIVSSDSVLMDAVLPYINFKNEAIDWEKFFALPLSPGQNGACLWAHTIWTDQIRPQSNMFEAALLMDSNLQNGVLKALRLRWGIRS